MTQPDFHNAPPFFKGYIEHVKHMELIEALKFSSVRTLGFVRSIPETKGEYRYAEGKWSIKEVLNHLMDVERIMSYRALCFARNDKTELPGFEEDDYAPEANAHGRTISELSDEMERLRATTIDMFSSFTPEMLGRKGLANKKELQVAVLGYIVSGHEAHHYTILKDRYLTK